MAGLPLENFRAGQKHIHPCVKGGERGSSKCVDMLLLFFSSLPSCSPSPSGCTSGFCHFISCFQGEGLSTFPCGVPFSPTIKTNCIGVVRFILPTTPSPSPIFLKSPPSPPSPPSTCFISKQCSVLTELFVLIWKERMLQATFLLNNLSSSVLIS